MEASSLAENIRDAIISFANSPGVLRQDYPWDSIYWVGQVLRIDIKDLPE